MSKIRTLELHLASGDWIDSINELRESITDQTNLLRPDGHYYRICRAVPKEEEFELHIFPFHKSQLSIHFMMRYCDLYVTRIDGRGTEDLEKGDKSSPMGKYSSLLFGEKRGLRGAIDNFESVKGKQTEGATIRSIIVFCVAESLRFDDVAAMVQREITTGIAIPYEDEKVFRACQDFCVKRGHEIIPKGMFHDRRNDYQKT